MSAKESDRPPPFHQSHGDCYETLAICRRGSCCDGLGVTNFDVEAVALHEAGHGLSQAHFGNIFFTNDGSLLRAPAAIMNPFIFGVDRNLLASDDGGHCSIWSQWPDK